jgi:hypothetical protein
MQHVTPGEFLPMLIEPQLEHPMPLDAIAFRATRIDARRKSKGSKATFIFAQITTEFSLSGNSQSLGNRCIIRCRFFHLCKTKACMADRCKATHFSLHEYSDEMQRQFDSLTKDLCFDDQVDAASPASDEL